MACATHQFWRISTKSDSDKITQLLGGNEPTNKTCWFVSTRSVFEKIPSFRIQNYRYFPCNICFANNNRLKKFELLLWFHGLISYILLCLYILSVICLIHSFGNDVQMSLCRFVSYLILINEVIQNKKITRVFCLYLYICNPINSCILHSRWNI